EDGIRDYKVTGVQTCALPISISLGRQTDMATNIDIINELKKAYAMELETVENYLANSIDLDGVRAEEIKKALAGDIEEELMHARSEERRVGKECRGRWRPDR